MARRVLALLLSACLALNVALPALTMAVVLWPDEAEARRSSSSGGYSRPGGGFSVRTPSVRSPSGSGGYSRPSIGGGGGFSFGTPSPGDLSQSRRSSGDALSRYRTRQQQPDSFGTGTGSTGTGSSGGGFTLPPPPVSSQRIPRYDRGDRWYSGRGWNVPSYAYRSSPRFGIWDGLMLWFLLDTLGNAGHAAWFHNHQNDPGYQQWRAEAEQQAQDNADLRAKLNQLDSQLAQMQGQPRDPNYIPPDIPPSAALADDGARTPTAGAPAADADDGGLGLPVILLVAGGGMFALWRMRRSLTSPNRSGDSSTMGSIKAAGNILGHKLSGEGYSPKLFRVGMTITLDPAPFILAGNVTKVPPPDLGGTDQLVSVAAVGTVGSGAGALYRLHLPDGKSFFQLHLDRNGQPDECRYFTRIDEVTPASEDEWGFWLDPNEGQIGWPEFQTKDGKLYQRAWAPGTTRTPPQDLTEYRDDGRSLRIVKSHAMLYAAPTDAQPPAPEVEYVLVSAMEEEGQAWVVVHAGIDVNPAALSLA